MTRTTATATPAEQRQRSVTGRPRAEGSRPVVTTITHLDEETARSFWDLYESSFGPLRTLAAARQVLHESEFLEEMTDPRVVKLVAQDATGRPVGLMTLTNALETIPWISPDYYRARYPLHFARQAVYYLGFTLVDKRTRNVLTFAAMLEAMLEHLSADQAVLGYDICAFNNESIRFADNIEKLLNRAGHVPVERLDSQTYYVADFSAV